MMAPVERFEGAGTLQPDGGGTTTPVPVKFAFVIVQTRRPTQPGLAPPPTRLDGRGTVTAASGTFPDGFYRLRTPAGEEARVQKLGSEWYIVAPRG